MAWLLAALAVVFAPALVLLVLALYWSRTPHGRLKPIFALGFRLGALLGQVEEGNELGTRDMGDPSRRGQARADFLKSVAGLARIRPFEGEIEDRVVDGPAGAIPVRVFRPAASGPLPLVVYLHGGGFVVGDPSFTEGVTRTLAARTPAVVVSVDYRLAPEHPFPAALDDCEAVVAWAAASATSLGARPGALVVAGDSAGGNLAAALCLRDRARGAGRVALQVLVYPVVDLTRTDRDSHRAFATGYGLSRQAVEECVAFYVPRPEERQLAEASPLLADSLAGLPRALVFTAGFDVLRDEGIEYAERLEKEGVPVRHFHEPHLPHGYLTMNRVCAEAEATLELIAAELRALG